MMNRMMLWSLCVIAFLGIGPAEVRSQVWEVFDMNTAGLPSNTIMDMAFAEDGYLWVATDWGLCGYDGAQWTVFQTENSGLPGNWLRCVAVAPDGKVWVGTDQHGVVIYDGVEWQVWSTLNSPLPADQVNRIVFDHRGWAWMGTVGGLACYTGTEWRVYNDQPASWSGLVLNGNNIRDIAVRSDGLVTLATLNGGFHFLTDTSVTVHATYIDFFPDNTGNDVLLDTLNNERWLACPAGGLLKQIGDWYGGNWFQYTSFNSALPSNSLNCLALGPQNALWIGSQLNGLFRRDGVDEYTHYTVANSGLPDNTVQRIIFDMDGDAWVGTFFGGVAHMDPVTAIETPLPSGVGLRAFPNPSTDKVIISLQEMAVGHWELFDAGGRKVNEGVWPNGRQIVLDLNGHVQGVYYFKLRSDLGITMVTVLRG